MKTLNEVIKAYEICTQEQSCLDCPYAKIDIDSKWACSLCGDCTRDALFYLKEYHWISENCAGALAEKYPSENIPLTWDELKQMTGKPVWVEDNIDEPEDTTKYWAIYRRIEKTQETEYALLSDFYYDKAQYGTTWQTYRKERK